MTAPARRRIARWGRAGRILLGALLATVLFRGCVAEPFRIPTASMASTLLAGDYVLATKYEYGARMPVTVGLPLTDVYLRNVELPYVRLPGLRPPRRGDVAVFNFPLGAAPLDRRQPYVKRIAGLPGDTVALEAKTLVVNGSAVGYPLKARHRWKLTLHRWQPLPEQALGQLGVDVEQSGSGLTFEATAGQAARVRALPMVAAVTPDVQSRARLSLPVFPGTPRYTRDDFGPLRVPERGDTLLLTTTSWPLYRDLVRRYERRHVTPLGGSFVVDGVKTNRVIVGQDYFFVLGDNLDVSADSRTWGFVPADHLIGRVRLTYFSSDPVEGALRWGRIMRIVR